MDSEEKMALGEQAYEKAARYELDYGCCPQCVLATVQETVGGIDDQTIKASHGLGNSPAAPMTCGMPGNTRPSTRREASSAPARPGR
jgi:hypothetical protein